MATGKAKNFPKEVLDEAYSFDESHLSIENRQLVEGITIDSQETKDLDDGINLYKKDGKYVVQVSICDVASLVKPETALFKESLSRVCTRYFAYSNIPMLPRVLSENRLSLLGGEMRPALTYDIELSEELTISKLTIKETVFRNRRRMSYPEFDDVLQNQKDDPDYSLFMECANLADALMERRKQKGALAIYDLKRMIYTTEEGMVQALRKEFAHISNIVIQEFMILANKAVACYSAEREIPLLYRNHTVRQNTPSREEILNQLETVTQNPKFILSLQERASLWFNRATYNPVLKGHFGLNEAAYTHITSPIRRVPDLINQILIKVYIKGMKNAPRESLRERNEEYSEEVPSEKDGVIEFPFGVDALEEMSNQINEKMIEIKDERSRFFIQKEQWQARLNLNYESSESLSEMDISDFKKVLKESIVHDLLLENLEVSLLRRISEGKLEAIHVYMILFETRKDSPIWFDIKIKVMEYMYNTAGMPVQILHLMVQNELLQSQQIEVVESKGSYTGRVIAFIEGKELTTEMYGTGKTKKEAQNKASYVFIIAYINDELLSKDEVPPLNSQVQPIELLQSQSVEGLDGKHADDDFPQENYVGMLLELCNKYMDWKMAEYQFAMSGPSHLPTITCECIMQTPQMTLKAQAVGSNKKIVKQIASKKILEQVEGNREVLLEASQSNVAGNQEQENYVGLVNDLCQKNNLKLPDYKYEHTGTQLSPQFTCRAVLQKDELTKEFSGTGTTKKAAKQDAAFRCYVYLSGLLGGMISE
jgi:ribonuclease R